MIDPAISAHGVVFSYGPHIAIDASSFSIPTGAITALIGPNGSGKSTLLNGIAGLIEPASGSLTLEPLHGRPRQVSYVFQATKVNEALPVTVREVVTMGRYAGLGSLRRLRADDRAAVDDAMRRMDVTSVASRHLAALSGGQRQRVFVAQGLAQQHDVLLLDEPLTGLDIVSAQAIDDVIHDEHARGCTVVMTTHDLAEARVADHVILLSGRVVAWGAPADVLTIEHLTEAYGASLLHVDGERLFIDDPHHHPTASRHTHERTIHVESSTTDAHPPHEH
ncbi:MAG: zinc ABC transporter ATP-binding protein AztA [Acidimicrobiia bacterium]|nr:zinc ABC transporter ATP-binding protein AztA [Acidimicrobiia bacterium]